MYGAAPPRTRRQNALIQAAFDARQAKRAALLEKNHSIKKKQALAQAAAEADAARAREAVAAAEKIRLEQEKAEQEGRLAQFLKEQQDHYEATRPRTLAELVEASMADEPRTGEVGTGTGSKSGPRARPGRCGAPSVGPRRPTGRS